MRVRPCALSPGSTTLVLSAGAIAVLVALTGSPAALVIVASLVVVLAASCVTGFVATHAADVAAVHVPAWVTAGECFDVQVAVHCASAVRVELLVDGAAIGSTWAVQPGEVRLTCVAPRRGEFSDLTVRCSTPGALGLVWWRSNNLTEVTLIVAAGAAAPNASVEMGTPELGAQASFSSSTGNGENDGTRPWREGDRSGDVHWPSTLRTRQTTVHHRGDEHQPTVLIAASSATDAEQQAAIARVTALHWLQAGAQVSIATDGGLPVAIDDADAAALWSARFPTAENSMAASWWRRPLGRQFVEQPLDAPARWWLTAATTVNALTLLQGLGTALTRQAVVVATLAAASWVSLRTSASLRRGLVGAVLGLVTAAALIDLDQVDSLSSLLRHLLPQLLVSLVVSQSADSVQRRSARVTLAIAVFLAAYAAAMRVDPSLAWWMLAGGALGVIAFFQLAETPAQPAARGRHAGASLLVAAATVGALQLVPVPSGSARLTLPSWMETQRPVDDNDGSLAGSDGSTLGDGDGGEGPTSRDGATTGGSYPGFTNSLDTALRGDLGDEVVLRVRADVPEFWRGQVFATFDGRQWRPSPHTGVGIDSNAPVSIGATFGDELPLDAPWDLHRYVTEVQFDDQRPTLTQTFYPQVDLQNLLFAAATPDTVLVDSALWQRPDGTLRTGSVITAGSAYTVVSRRSMATPTSLRSVGTVRLTPPGSGATPLDDYLEIPASTSPRTLSLAAELAAGSPTTYDFVRAIEGWLGENTEYSLEAPVPPTGQDSVDHFLFDGRLGFCEQIASATTIMLRSQGVPARLVTGYVPSERDRVSGVWISRAKDAHAWVEVYFPGTGWVPFDPTAQVPMSGQAFRPSVGGELWQAASSFVTNHSAALGLMLALTASVVVAIIAAATARRRAARGRWGRLQDRFVRLAEARGAPPGASNPALAEVWPDSLAARAVARRLDEVAFGSDVADDDALFEATAELVDRLG